MTTIKKLHFILACVLILVVGYGAGMLLHKDSNGESALPGTTQNGEPSTQTGKDTGAASQATGSAGIGATTTKGGYTSTKITYATIDGDGLELSLIKPTTGSNFSTVVWIHGGSFGPGGTNAAQGYEDDFTGKGYAIAAVAYRSMLEGNFPTQLEDVKGAIRYLRAHASELSLNPDSIFVMGTSSGGLLASLTGVTSDYSAYEGTTGGNTNVSSDVAGVVDLFGSVTRAQIDDLSPTIIPTTYEIFGCQPNTNCPDRMNLAVDNYITAGDPPFLIIHGTDDQTVPYQESVELSGLLKAAGIPTTFITATGYGHDKDGIITKYFGDIISFLDANK